MARLTLTVEGPEMVIALIERALAESDKVLICPETIHPGYVATIVKEQDS